MENEHDLTVDEYEDLIDHLLDCELDWTDVIIKLRAQVRRQRRRQERLSRPSSRRSGLKTTDREEPHAD